MKVSSTQASSMITSCIKAKLVPLLVGSPGSGKSQIIHQIADSWKLKVIDLRLSQCDPSDLLGYPNIIGNKAGYVPMNTFPIEGDPIPEGYSGWMLLLDEITSASPAIQAAAYKIVLDRTVGIYPLHKNVAIVCAGNLETDNAVVQPMSTALQSRLIHMELVVNHTEWIDWATSNGINHFITDFIKFKPGSLYTFSPDHTDSTYACPRTWHFASKLMDVTDLNDKDIVPLLAGTLSEGVAREFMTFTKIYNDLPSMLDIQNKPETIPVPVEPSILFALTGSISHNITVANIEQIMKFVVRLPVEFQVVTLREIVRRDKSLVTNPSIQQWITTSAAKLF